MEILIGFDSELLVSLVILGDGILHSRAEGDKRKGAATELELGTYVL